MAGNKIGGLRARETNYAKHGRDFYQKVGRIGGLSTAANGSIKGFAAMPVEKRREAGAKGGSISNRAKYTGTIKNIGIVAWLDKHKSRYNGLDGLTFTALVDDGLSDAAISKIYEISTSTLFNWRRAYRVEQNLTAPKKKASVEV